MLAVALLRWADEDFNGWRIDYRLAGFWNVETEQAIRVLDIRDEITSENRICTLEQAEVYVKAVEIFMEDMAVKNEKQIFCSDINREYSREIIFRPCSFFNQSILYFKTSIPRITISCTSRAISSGDSLFSFKSHVSIRPIQPLSI